MNEVYIYKVIRKEGWEGILKQEILGFRRAHNLIEALHKIIYEGNLHGLDAIRLNLLKSQKSEFEKELPPEFFETCEKALEEGFELMFDIHY